MSRSLVQPIGQKRLTNVAVVRLKKHGLRFEIACFKNKVLSWRSRVEKDIDEVLQTHTVYNNVSKGILAKSKDLIAAFGSDDQDKICLEILEKGELQVSGKEREAHLSNQFRDIATIVMKKTVNSETQRPYTISMIERLMRDVHFAVDSNKSSKKQALELIRQLQKQFSIVRARMRLQLLVPSEQGSKLSEKLKEWDALIEQSDVSNATYKVICQLEPGHFRDCDAFLRDLNGRLDVLSMAVQKEGDGTVDDFVDDPLSHPSSSTEVSPKESSNEVPNENDLSLTLADKLSLKPTETAKKASGKERQMKCNTCNAEVGDAAQHREHFKSDWHKHNLKRKVKNLPPVSAEEWMLDTEIVDEVNDLNEYSR